MSARRAFTIELTEKQIEEIETHVASGAYASASEVVAAGMAALLEAHGSEDVLESAAFLEECDEIVRRIDAGVDPTFSLDEVMKTLRSDLAARGDVKRPAAG